MDQKVSRKSSAPYIVGIGASAGGLEALEAFFKSFPNGTGLSFVVIQHLSPDFKSMMDELLARHTKMRIYPVDQETKIEQNCIYLIPPKKNLTINGNSLIPWDQDPEVQLRLPIDTFFTSLAEEYGSNAIGVILSGTGSDGTRGAAAIKENEGFVIAQEPSSCRFDGMPKSVIRRGIPDKIMRPESMSEMILNYTQNPGVVLDTLSLTHETDKLSVINSLLSTVDGLDFTNYRPSTIIRRIERRVKINHMKDLNEYIHLLRSDLSELTALHGEILIGVTKFFRDREAFSFLSDTVIPKIIEQASHEDTIRIWVAGCSTGEEAYSIGMCFQDYLDDQGLFKELKIFATDVDTEALEVAVAGRYPESIAEDVGAERIAKYFSKTDSYYEVKAKLRRSIIFSQHNTVKDPPFTCMNLVSCRNLLIYFQPSLQAKAISLFHFGLKNNGCLFLGKSEALGELAAEFEVISPTYKFFQKLRDVKLALASNISMNSHMASNQAREPIYRQNYLVEDVSMGREPRIGNLYEKLLNEYVPASLMVDQNCQLLHTFGDASRFLEIPPGKSTFNVLKMLGNEMSVALGTAISRAMKSEKEVVFKDVRQPSTNKVYNLKVRPVQLLQKDQHRSFMVIFEELTASDELSEHAHVEIFNQQSHALEQIKNLEEQLQGTRESLQSTIEELETTNEELQSTNEELMPSNEELQSSNEELQSVKEELYTVNTEHQSKIEELTQANYDIDFLLKSSNIGTIFLDENLLIRRYNKDIEDIVNVMPQDIGRPITDITFNFDHDHIVNQIRSVAKTATASSSELVWRGKTYLVKSIPYRSTMHPSELKKSPAFNNGVMLTFIDVSNLKEAREIKRLSEDAEEFNYVVSHDLRKPLRRLSQLTSKIKKGLEFEEHSKTIDSDLTECESSIDKLTSMLDVLLKYSRLRTKGGEFIEFDPHGVVSEAISSLKIDSDSVDIDIGYLPHSIVGDSEQFTELVVSIVKNAIDHHGSTRPIKIDIGAVKKNDIWRFDVKDNGVGFSDQDSEKAFEIFYRGSELEEGGRCLGVGLSFAKRIVDRHGGQIWIEANNGPGSTVHFTIPKLTTPRL
ncbi:MAG: PAS domain-containing protein [Pseudobacteriovorax sp.]|nr:PAS domain-containing protein [Pseudobacteriovorax sp.]